jgi:hypothetical protein
MASALFSKVLVLAPLFVAATTPSQVPVLHYEPPPNTFRAGLSTPEDYSFNTCNASIQFYPFRPFSGDIEQQFKQTLLRDWVGPMHQEQNVAGAPTFAANAVPGATKALSATFVENIVGLPRPHLRIVVVAGNQAAIVDASAATMQSWQIAVSALTATAGSLRVEAGRAPTPLTAAGGRAVAGLYQGMKQKYMATMVNVIGGGYYTPALHFFLLSPSGRVYRAYDKLDVPGGNPARFDFDAAQSRDPGNSGTYTIDGGNLLMRFGGPSPETIVTAAPKGGTFTVYSVRYTRQ